MADGNLSRIIVWVNDTVIVKKQLEGQSLLLRRRRRDRPAGGQGRTSTFFGWKQVHVQRQRSTAWTPPTFTADHRRGRPAAARPDKMPAQDTSLLAVADHRAQGEGRPGRRRSLRLPRLQPASGIGQIYDPEYNADQGLHHHRSAGLSAGAEGPVQVLGPARQVRPARRLRLRRPDLHRRDPQSQGRKGPRARVSPPTTTAASPANICLPKGATLGTYGISRR